MSDAVGPGVVIGHRGAAAEAPENTLAGVDRAAADGVGWVEFDTKLSADGVAVVFHDDTLERTTDGAGRVADTPLGELARLDAGAWYGPRYAGETVPRLAALLRRAHGHELGVDIEIKPSPGRERETAEIVVAEARRVWPATAPAPLLTSFKPVCLEVARACAPAWPRGLIWLEEPADWRDQTAALGCAYVVCLHRHLTPRHIDAYREAGLTVLAFTVNDPLRARELLAWGVHSVVTDAPEAMQAALSGAPRLGNSQTTHNLSKIARPGD